MQKKICCSTIHDLIMKPFIIFTRYIHSFACCALADSESYRSLLSLCEKQQRQEYTHKVAEAMKLNITNMVCELTCLRWLRCSVDS